MANDQTINLVGGHSVKVRAGQGKSITEAIRVGQRFAEVKDTEGNKVAIAINQIVSIKEATELRKVEEPTEEVGEISNEDKLL